MSRSKISSSLLYVDLLYRTSSQFAVWEPAPSLIQVRLSDINRRTPSMCQSDILQVGDYGDVDRLSGQFEPHGNIFTDPTFREQYKDYPPVVRPFGSAAITTITSENTKARNAKERDLGASGIVDNQTEALALQVVHSITSQDTLSTDSYIHNDSASTLSAAGPELCWLYIDLGWYVLVESGVHGLLHVSPFTDQLTAHA